MFIHDMRKPCWLDIYWINVIERVPTPVLLFASAAKSFMANILLPNIIKNYIKEQIKYCIFIYIQELIFELDNH